MGHPEEDFEWLSHYGLSRGEIARLLPTLPGGLTSANSFYVNTMIPRMIFRGREQTSIPLTAGRWYLIPLAIVERHHALRDSPAPLAAAASKLPVDAPRSIAAWTAGG
jgi:hypothetical protein